MKKGIIGILLVIVMVLTMTACVNKTETQNETTETQLIAIVETRAEVIALKEDMVFLEKSLSVDEIRAMNQEDISAYFEKLLRISETRTLSSEEMNHLGNCFEDIWWYKVVCYPENFKLDMEEFETQSCKVFNNIYEQACEQNIPLNELYSWTSIPVAQVLCKYFSSENFSETKDLSCNIFCELTEEDAHLVADAVFENPVFASNFVVATDALYNTCAEVQEMAWAHLDVLTKSFNPELTAYTEKLCHELLWECFEDEEKLFDITKNIMDNPSFDFVVKYTLFSTYGWDDNIRNQAIENLFALAENAEEENAKLIEQVVNEMSDSEIANELLKVLKAH